MWTNPEARRTLLQQIQRDKESVGRMSPQMLLIIGQVLATDPAAAGEWHRQALVAYPADFWLNYQFGYMLYDAKKVPKAEGCYRLALAIRPDAVAAWHNLGLCLYAQQDLSGAIDAYRKALEFDGNYALAWSNLGLALMAKPDLPRAVVAYQKALGLLAADTPRHAQVQRALQDAQVLLAREQQVPTGR